MAFTQYWSSSHLSSYLILSILHISSYLILSYLILSLLSHLIPYPNLISQLHGPHLISSDLLSLSYLSSHQSQSMIPSLHSLIFAVVYPKNRSWPTGFTLDTVPLGSMISRNSIICTVSFVRWWYPAVHLFHFSDFFLSLETLTTTFISQQRYHPSQFLCSQSWFHLWPWHVCLWLS